MKAFAIVFFMITTANAAYECPQKIQVSVTGIKTISNRPDIIDVIYQSGGVITPKPYFIKVVNATSKVSEINETLALDTTATGIADCSYKGKSATLDITNIYSTPIRANLTAIPVEYSDESYSTSGNQVHFSTTLKSVTSSTIEVEAKAKKEIFVIVKAQTPFGNGAGYNAQVTIGAIGKFDIKLAK